MSSKLTQSQKYMFTFLKDFLKITSHQYQPGAGLFQAYWVWAKSVQWGKTESRLSTSRLCFGWKRDFPPRISVFCFIASRLKLVPCSFPNVHWKNDVRCSSNSSRSRSDGLFPVYTSLLYGIKLRRIILHNPRHLDFLERRDMHYS